MRIFSMIVTAALALLPAARAAHADGWWEGCNNDESAGGGCNCDQDESTDDGVSCRTGGGPASVGTGFATLAVVAYGLGRRRKK
jgi:MYXO-CTERM domain-containing protein